MKEMKNNVEEEGGEFVNPKNNTVFNESYKITLTLGYLAR